MENWQTVYSLHMQTRTITWSEVQKFKEFGQGLKEVRKHCFCFQPSKRYSESRNRAQTSSPFSCWSQVPSAFAAAPNTMLLRDWFNGWHWPLYWEAVIKVGSHTLHSPFTSLPSSSPPSLTLRLNRINSVIWRKTHFSTACASTDHECIQLRTTDW